MTNETLMGLSYTGDRKRKLKLNKREREWVESYKKSYTNNLLTCYKKPSNWKRRAFEDCKEEMELLFGYDMKIINYGFQFFSCGFLYKNIYGDEVLRVYTHKNTYDIIFNENKKFCEEDLDSLALLCELDNYNDYKFRVFHDIEKQQKNNMLHANINKYYNNIQ